MGLRARAALLSSVFLLVPPGASDVAWAWTPRMEEKVALEAIRLMPPALHRILVRERAALVNGLREAAAEEAGPEHHLVPGQRGPSAANRVAALTEQAVKSIDKQRPFSRVASEMGALAHFICDLNDPLKVSGEGERPFAGDYYAYVERNLPKYPLVFYGWEDAILDQGGVEEFAHETARRARRYHEPIAAAYAAGDREAAGVFDERSLPFGIGSLSYSRSVTDTARLWLHVWKSAHGDTRGMPYPTPEASREAGAE